jgi:hypothetical protein
MLGFRLRGSPEIIVAANVPLLAQLIEKSLLWINRKLESLNGSLMFATASYHSVSCSTQGGPFVAYVVDLS